MYNGWTPAIDVVTRIYNLIEQIPAEYRKAAESECFSTGMSDHEYERNLTGYVMRKGWITDEQRKQAAEAVEIDNWLDSDSMFETLDAIGANPDAKKYDFTPFPADMPIIDMDNIEEIPL